MAPTAQTILIEGAGIAAALAAVTFKRALPAAAVHWPGASRSTTATDPAGIALYGAGGEALEALHKRIGLDHRLFSRRTRAVALESIMVEGFGSDCALPLIATMPYVDGASLVALWNRARRHGATPVPSLATLCQRVGAAQRREWRFDPIAYRGLLVDMATAIGVITEPSFAPGPGPLLTVQTDQRIDEDWISHEQLPPVAVSLLNKTDVASAHDRLVRTGYGISWHGPVQSCLLSSDPPGGAVAVASGYHRRPRVGTMLRLGEAAVQGFSPDGTMMDVLCEDMLSFLTLGPGDSTSPRLDAEYSRRASIRYGHWAEWLALHWRAPGSACARHMPGLQSVLDDWDRRGWLGFRDGDAVVSGAWVAWLAVTRPAPARIDPVAMNIGAQTMRWLFGEGYGQ